MRYLLIMGTDSTATETESTREEMVAWTADLDARGGDVTGDRLRPVADATTVRLRDGQAFITDGPFTEAKEWIAGYHVIEAADLDEAIAIAQGHPGARLGAIEIRPAWPFSTGRDTGRSSGRDDG